jgi:hypothetical protein
MQPVAAACIGGDHLPGRAARWCSHEASESSPGLTRRVGEHLYRAAAIAPGSTALLD